MLRLFALVAVRCLQRLTHAVAVSPVLRRPARFFLRNDLRDFSSAIFDKHAAIVALGAAIPVCRTQRRDQYDRVQSAVVARKRAADSQRFGGWTVVQRPRTKRQRLGEL